MRQVKAGDTIKVHYHGKLLNGKTFDSSSGRQPLEFKVGSGSVIKGFDQGVLGMIVGEKRRVEIPAQDAYGSRDPRMVMDYPLERFPKDISPSVGMQLQLGSTTGKTLQAVIREIKNDVAVLDANHPLAGETLVFELELMDINSSAGSPDVDS